MSELRFLGTFGSTVDTDNYGELTVDGAKTAIRIVGENLGGLMAARTLYGQTVRGKVTCIECVATGANWILREESPSAYATIFPHFVTHGPIFFDPDTNEIASVSFRFSDIDVIFEQSDVFGTFQTTPELMEAILAARPINTARDVGEIPLVSYFSGQQEVWSAQTVFGKISVRNRCSYDARDVFQHSLEMSIEFIEGLGLQGCIDKLVRARQFLTVVAGRPQEINSISVAVRTAGVSSDAQPTRLDLVWCLSPAGPSDSDIEPRRFALPLSALHRTEEFTSVAIDWFERDEGWHWPRARYAECIESGDYYTGNRLVAAANMFDLLPASAVPAVIEMDPAIAEAVAKSKAIFKVLPDSVERSTPCVRIDVASLESL